MLSYVLGLAIVCAFWFFPFAAEAAAPRTFRDLAGQLVDIMNSAIGVLIAAAIVMYFFGIVRHVFKKEGGDASQQNTYLVMGLIAIFVMVSVWGILGLLKETFFSASPSGVAPSPSDPGFRVPPLIDA